MFYSECMLVVRGSPAFVGGQVIRFPTLCWRLPLSLAVKDVANAFLNAKRDAKVAGELSPRTWADYKSIMDRMVIGLGKHTPVVALDPQEFARLKTK